ncbi:MAG: helix-turn-helix transcriptional regulator [Acidimicrobiales bacterium]
MRADRLVSIILILQARRQVTAGELAAELEVSERTIRRDLDALVLSGVPIYAQRGRGGGWALVGGHKLNVSGLTAEEAQALTLVVGPVALGGLGLEADVRSAVRKLLAALPEPVRQRALAANTLIHHDPSSWGNTGETADQPPHLPALRHAISNNLQVDLGYRKLGGDDSSRRVQPLGLVLKKNAWYLLALTPAGARTFRVSRVTGVSLTDEPVVRPEGFDLEAMWGEIREGFSRQFGIVTVRFRVEAGSEVSVSQWLGSWIPLIPVAGGCYEASFPHESIATLELGRLGDRVEVLSPASVRESLAELGRALIARYAVEGRDEAPTDGE